MLNVILDYLTSSWLLCLPLSIKLHTKYTNNVVDEQQLKVNSIVELNRDSAGLYI